MAEDVSAKFSACHCGTCQRWNGGAPFFAVSVGAVTFTGTEHIGRFDSSSWAQRGFCKQCGTHLFYFLKPAQRYLMSLGTLEDAAGLTMSREIFIDRKHGGYSLAGDHERWTEAETFQRLAPPV